MSSLARAWVDVGPYLNIGWMFVVSTGTFGLLGWWLDGKLGTGRLLLVLGCVGGIGLGFVNFFKVALGTRQGRRK